MTPDIFPYSLPVDLPVPEVTFAGGHKALRGNVLTPTQVQDAPTVRFADAEVRKTTPGCSAVHGPPFSGHANELFQFFLSF